MPNKFEIGLIGQEQAERYLVKKGYQILERNFCSHTYEIDLIASDGVYIVFVEVKSRNNLKYGLPREAVSKEKQRRIKKAALFYIARHQLSSQDFRFDVVEVLSMNGKTDITHIENAFM